MPDVGWACGVFVGGARTLLVSWALSVAIEGLVLMVLVREHPVRQVWPASVAANVGSYAVTLLILFLARWANVV